MSSRPQSQDTSAVFSFNPWGSVSLSIDLEREGKERRGERERGALFGWLCLQPIKTCTW